MGRGALPVFFLEEEAEAFDELREGPLDEAFLDDALDDDLLDVGSEDALRPLPFFFFGLPFFFCTFAIAAGRLGVFGFLALLAAALAGGAGGAAGSLPGLEALERVTGVIVPSVWSWAQLGSSQQSGTDK